MAGKLKEYTSKTVRSVKPKLVSHNNAGSSGSGNYSTCRVTAAKQHVQYTRVCRNTHTCVQSDSQQSGMYTVHMPVQELRAHAVVHACVRVCV